MRNSLCPIWKKVFVVLRNRNPRDVTNLKITVYTCNLTKLVSKIFPQILWLEDVMMAETERTLLDPVPAEDVIGCGLFPFTSSIPTLWGSNQMIRRQMNGRVQILE